MPLCHPHMYPECTQQKPSALQLLALSGVIRPSHVALRYTVSLPSIEEQSDGSHGKGLAAVLSSRLAKKFFRLIAWPMKVSDHKATREHACFTAEPISVLSNAKRNTSRGTS